LVIVALPFPFANNKLPLAFVSIETV